MLTKKSYSCMYMISKESKCFNWILDYRYLPHVNNDLNYEHLLHCSPFLSPPNRVRTIPYQSITIQIPEPKQIILDTVQIDLSNKNKFLFNNPNAFYSSNCTVYFRPDTASFY